MIRIHNFSCYLKRALIPAVPAVLMIAGCASAPVTTESLERARSAYAKVQSDPNISANAEVASYEAGQALKAAEQAEDVPTQEHLSYIAEKKALMAVSIAQGAMAEKEAQKFATEKDRLLLKAREAEVESARRQAEEAEAKTKRMEAEMAELKAKETERGMVLTLGDVLFATGKAALRPAGMQIVDRLADFMQKYPDINVLVEGHTDNVGKAEYNEFLSKRRADAVKTALIEKGVNSERITTKGYGETYPVASNKTSSGRQQNRRVEIVVLNQGESPEEKMRK